MNAPQQPQGTLTYAAPGTLAYNPAWFALTDVYLDPQAGSDSNTGQVGQPVQTFAEIVRRYGSVEPQAGYAQHVSVHLLSNQAPGQDPIFFAPKVSGGGWFKLLGTLVPTGSPFSPSTVTAKNKAAGQRLVLNGVPGGIAQKTLIQNTTSALAGWAFVDAIAGGNATMSQPIANSTIQTVGVPTLVEDNGWSSTDTYQAYTLPQVNLKSWRPRGGDESSSSIAGGGWVQNVEILDSSGTGASEFPLTCDAAVTVLSNCLIDTRVDMVAIQGRSQACYLVNCYVVGLLAAILGTPKVLGGVLVGGLQSLPAQLNIDGDTNVHGTCNFLGPSAFLGSVYFDGSINIFDGCAFFVSTSLWGTASISVGASSAYCNSSGTTFAASLLTTGALKLGTSTTGTKYAAGVWTDGIAISAANLDTNGGLQNPRTGARFCLPE